MLGTLHLWTWTWAPALRPECRLAFNNVDLLVWEGVYITGLPIPHSALFSPHAQPSTSAKCRRLNNCHSFCHP